MNLGWPLGIGMALAISAAPAGFAERPVEQLPKDVSVFSFAWVALPETMAEVAQDHGPLAGASWGVVKGSSAVVERVVGLTDPEDWLNQEAPGTRQSHRDSPLLRYTF